MGNVLDEYFALTDRASYDWQALPQIVQLFADEAEVKPAGAEPVKGKQAITKLLERFYQSYSSIHRAWKPCRKDNGVEVMSAIWAIVGKRYDGKVFALHGRHKAQVNEAGKIANLEVELLAGDRPTELAPIP